jgi:hypothetical protein
LGADELDDLTRLTFTEPPRGEGPGDQGVLLREHLVRPGERDQRAGVPGQVLVVERGQRGEQPVHRVHDAVV